MFIMNYQNWVNISNSEDFISKYINALNKNREIDSALNKTSLNSQ